MGILLDIPESTGKGGSTTTGNICDWSPPYLSMFGSECFQTYLSELLNRLWLIISVYKSKSKDDINISLYKELCAETYLLLLNKFKNHEARWISTSPALHILLAYSWEIIESNNNCGLGEYSDNGLENNNKFLLIFRVSLVRKT